MFEKYFREKNDKLMGVLTKLANYFFDGFNNLIKAKHLKLFSLAVKMQRLNNFANYNISEIKTGCPVVTSNLCMRCPHFILF